MATDLPRIAWKRYLSKEGSQGPMWAEFAIVRGTTVRVWAVWRRSLGPAREFKFHLSNAPLACERRDLAQMSGWRWPIETTIAEANGEIGMDHYEIRSWLGWHHHMVQSFMAHLFLTRLRLRLKKSPGPHYRPGASVGDLRLAGRQPALGRYHSHYRIPPAPKSCRLPLTPQTDSQTLALS